MSATRRLDGERADMEAEARRAQHAGATRTPMDENAALARARAAQEITEGPQDGEGPPMPRRPMGDRVPFGESEQQLAHDPIPGFHLHWFNDTPSRIDRAKKAGYEHVDDRNGPISRNVGRGDRGDGLKAFLMKIPLHWYEEDMAASQDALGRRLRDIRDGRLNAQPGSNQYVPSTGIRIESGRR